MRAETDEAIFTEKTKQEKKTSHDCAQGEKRKKKLTAEREQKRIISKVDKSASTYSLLKSEGTLSNRGQNILATDCGKWKKSGRKEREGGGTLSKGWRKKTKPKIRTGGEKSKEIDQGRGGIGRSWSSAERGSWVGERSYRGVTKYSKARTTTNRMSLPRENVEGGQGKKRILKDNSQRPRRQEGCNEASSIFFTGTLVWWRDGGGLKKRFAMGWRKRPVGGGNESGPSNSWGGPWVGNNCVGKRTSWLKRRSSANLSRDFQVTKRPR